jgi:hypothetical protein
METSPEIKQLAGALSAFQSEVGNVGKDGLNPYFKSKYATLENVVNTVREPLHKNGLSFSQFPTGENELATILMHNSGEWIKATAKMTPKDASPQGQGSAITYLRRYALSAILGLATEEDDDGNAASKAPERPKMASYSVQRAVPASDDEAGTKQPIQILEQDEIDVVLKDQIKDLIVALGKKPTKTVAKELTGLDMEPVNYKAIKAKLTTIVDATDPLKEVFENTK